MASGLGLLGANVCLNFCNARARRSDLLTYVFHPIFSLVSTHCRLPAWVLSKCPGGPFATSIWESLLGL